MSAVEMAVEKVKQMDEEHAKRLLEWLETGDSPVKGSSNRKSAAEMLGFARRFRSKSRSTASWMKELREGEE